MRSTVRLASAVLAAVVAGCASTSSGNGTTTTPSPVTPATAAPSVAATATTRPTVAPPSPTPMVPTICAAGKDEFVLVIDGKSNLFAAGLDKPVAPAGGGPGLLPPFIELPSGKDRTMEVPCTAGEVNCCSNNVEYSVWATPAGTDAYQTDIESYGGISGIIVGDRSIFLAGVFLGDAPPAEPAPERLDQTGKVTFKGMAPAIGQTFVIGTGKGSTWTVPAGATRLYLGIADALFTHGLPGFYGNNTGRFEATVRISVE